MGENITFMEKARKNATLFAGLITLIVSGVFLIITRFLSYIMVQGKLGYYGIKLTYVAPYDNILFDFIIAIIIMFILFFNHILLLEIPKIWEREKEKKNNMIKRIFKIISENILLIIIMIVILTIIIGNQNSFLVNFFITFVAYVMLEIFYKIIRFDKTITQFKELITEINEERKKKNYARIFAQIIFTFLIIMSVGSALLYSYGVTGEKFRNTYYVTNKNQIIIYELNDNFIVADYVTEKDKSIIINSKNIEYLPKIGIKLEKIYIKNQIIKIIK